MFVSITRIEVRRNLKNFPLGAGVTKEQRDEIMNLVIRACESFEGELAGNFHSLDSIKDEDR